MQLMKEFIMLEQRIICRVLPRNFNLLDNIIKLHLYKPLIQDFTSIEFKNQTYKIIQQLKRTWLNIYFNGYEIKIHGYEYEYQENLHQFQMQFECYRNINRIAAVNTIKTFLKNRKQRLLEQIYEDMRDFRKNLLTYRRRSTKAKNRIDVCPQPVYYLLYNPFSHQERDYLAKGRYSRSAHKLGFEFLRLYLIYLGPNYIRPNQSALMSENRKKRMMKKEHNNITKALENYLVNYHHVQRTIPIFKIFADDLRQRYDLRYMSRLSISEQNRAQRELNLVKSIHKKLKKYKLIIRQTDKSGVFCILCQLDHEVKAKQYRDKTQAYKELPSNPFELTLNKVIRSLNDLHTKDNKISGGPYKKMRPNPMNCKLAYMYFNPKTHKVSFRLVSHSKSESNELLYRLGWYAISTNYEYN